jgi:hypothetical protein
MSNLSDCCDAPVVHEDICSRCGEHCEPICGECHNSGIVRIENEWEDCDCGCPFNRYTAEHVYADWIR